MSYFRKKIAMLNRLSIFASCMVTHRILCKFCSSLKAKHYHVINFLVSFRGYIEIPIFIIIVVQTLCNDVWSRYNVCDCYFMMTGIQSFLRDTWHSNATVMRVFIMCMIGGWDERKLCLMASLRSDTLTRVSVLRWHIEDE